MFEKGQLVVCVADKACYCGINEGLKCGLVYTVASVLPPDKRGNHGITLEELSPSPGHWGFGAIRFRPLPSSQISLVNSMLVTKKAKEPALSGEQGDAA